MVLTMPSETASAALTRFDIAMIAGAASAPVANFLRVRRDTPGELAAILLSSASALPGVDFHIWTTAMRLSRGLRRFASGACARIRRQTDGSMGRQRRRAARRTAR